MAKAIYQFPRGFLWGTVTSSHQVEGNNTNNNWWAWEQQAGRILDGSKSGMACDWWGGRYREDFDRAQEGNQNAHRLSIEWSRVQPAPDRWDENALDRYRNILRSLYERSLTPLVTLHHFTLPLWMEERGGWENPDSVTWFTAYAQKVVEALKEYATLWVTINEPNVLVAYMYALGGFPPGKRGIAQAPSAMINLARAHASAYQAIHELQPHSRVGLAFQILPMTPHRNWSPFDRWIASLLNGLVNEFFPNAFASGVLRFPGYRKRIPALKGTQDFFGLNYYTRQQVAFNLFKPTEFFSRRFFSPGAELSDTKQIANDPEGLFSTIKWAQKFNLPIIVTENGIENADDSLRPSYLIQHLHQIWRAVNFNWPVKGYFHWTLVDNFEWERGWTQRFGLWGLDIQTQARIKRPSVDLYAEICRTNGISSETVARFAPDILGKLFPD